MKDKPPDLTVPPLPKHPVLSTVLAAVALVVLLGACELGDSPARSPRTSTAPDNSVTASPSATKSTPEPTPTPDPDAQREAAAAEYLELADRVNERGEELFLRLREVTSLDEARIVWEEFAALEEEFLGGLESIDVPEEVEDEVAAVREMELSLIDLAERLAAAETDEAYAALIEEYIEGQPGRREITNRLRVALGLEPLPTPTPAG